MFSLERKKLNSRTDNEQMKDYEDFGDRCNVNQINETIHLRLFSQSPWVNKVMLVMFYPEITS